MSPTAHGRDPVTDLYVPAGHAVHSPPSGPVYPVLHLQSVKALLPAGELEPVGQSEHCALPVMSLYVPSTHAVQSLPLLSVYPALHLQSWIEPPGR